MVKPSWPSGLERWITCRGMRGVGSNPAKDIYFYFKISAPFPFRTAQRNPCKWNQAWPFNCKYRYFRPLIWLIMQSLVYRSIILKLDNRFKYITKCVDRQYHCVSTLANICGVFNGRKYCQNVWNIDALSLKAWRGFILGPLRLSWLLDYLQIWDPVNRFNHTSSVAIVTPTDRPKSVRNRFLIEVFGGVFVFSRCFFDFSVGVGAFVIGLSQISSFFT